MSHSIQQADRARHLLRSDPPRRTAKVEAPKVRKADLGDLRRVFGAAIDEARRANGWLLKELVAEIEKATGTRRDERQVAKWISGEDHPQVAVVWAVEKMRAPFVLALARRVHEIEIEQTMRWRQTA